MIQEKTDEGLALGWELSAAVQQVDRLSIGMLITTKAIEAGRKPPRSHVSGRHVLGKKHEAKAVDSRLP